MTDPFLEEMERRAGCHDEPVTELPCGHDLDCADEWGVCQNEYCQRERERQRIRAKLIKARQSAERMAGNANP